MIKLSGTKASKRSLGEELCISQGQGDRPVAHSEEGLAGEQQQVRLENATVVAKNVIVPSGHDAVQQPFHTEQCLVDEHGTGLIFSVFRPDIEAASIKQFKGPKTQTIQLPANGVHFVDPLQWDK